MSAGIRTFNPVKDAVRQHNEIGAINRATYAGTWKTYLCWRCQKDKPKHAGVISMALNGVSAATPGNVRRFICNECTAARAARKAVAA